MALDKLTSDMITDGTIVNSDINASAAIAQSKLVDIADGTVTNAKIATGIDASKLTGTIDVALIPEAAVTQHVAAIDLTPVHQSIATLGLHMGVSANAVAFNLPNAFIDTFEDDTGIATETDVDRNASDEYVASVSYGSATAVADGTMADTWHFAGTSPNGSGVTNGGGVTSGMYTPHSGSGGQFTFYWASPSTGYATSFYIDYLQSYTWAKINMSTCNTLGHVKTFRLQKSDDGTNWTVVDMTGTTSTTGGFNSSYDNIISGFDSTGVMTFGDINTACQGGGLLTFGTPFSARYLRMEIDTWRNAGNANVGWGVFIPWYTPITTSATGTLISDTQTAPAATTEVSGVILYKDNAGTATLGTQLKIYFTANNGTNWTEAASYGTAQTFSGTTKQVKLGKTTVTSGTQVAMKAVWASQASGSMETQLHGWAVNY